MNIKNPFTDEWFWVKSSADSWNFSLSNVRNTAIINLELRMIRKINDRRKQASFRKVQSIEEE